MWASSRPCRPPPPSIILSKTSSRPVSHFPVSVSVTFHRQHRRAPPLQSSKSSSSSSAEEIGGLGHAVLTALKSNIIDSKTPITNTPVPKPKPKQPQQEKQKQEKQKQQEGEERQQLSGSDVLWALTKAAAQNKKKKASVGGGGKKMKKGLNYGVDDSSSSSSSSSNRDGVYEEDYSNVRPLNIKSDWVTRLDDLEKRLKELSLNLMN